MADMTRFLSSDSIRRALHYCKLIAAAYIDYFIREAPVEVLEDKNGSTLSAGTPEASLLRAGTQIKLPS